MKIKPDNAGLGGFLHLRTKGYCKWLISTNKNKKFKQKGLSSQPFKSLGRTILTDWPKKGAEPKITIVGQVTH